MLTIAKIVACKTIHYAEGRFARVDVEREFAILTRLRHVNIVRYLDIAWFPKRAKLYMEYCDRQSLQDLIHRNKLLVPLVLSTIASLKVTIVKTLRSQRITFGVFCFSWSLHCRTVITGCRPTKRATSFSRLIGRITVLSCTGT